MTNTHNEAGLSDVGLGDLPDLIRWPERQGTAISFLQGNSHNGIADFIVSRIIQTYKVRYG